MITKKLDKKNVEDMLALTAMQEGILFHYLSNPGSSQYFEQLSMRLTGIVRIELIKKAWNFVAQNNEILRTFFRWEKLEKPVQVVLKNYEIPVRVFDYSDLSEDVLMERVEELREADRKENIDISTEPFRITLAIFGNKQCEMIISNHHILYDGWSNAILIKEFFEAYQAFYEGQEPVIKVKNKYREFIKWHQSQGRLGEQSGGSEITGHNIDCPKDYWTKYLEGFNDRTLLPWDKKRQADIVKADVYTYQFSQNMAEKLNAFARDRKVAPASVLYAAWGMLLQRYSNTEDVIFGTTISGRTAKIKGIENMAGLFINTPPLRLKLNSGECVNELLDGIERNIRERGQFENTPLIDIKSCSEMDSKESLFDSIIVIENYPLDKELKSREGILKLECYSTFEMTNFDIAVAISLFEEMEVKFIYNGDLFYRETIERMAGHFANIIESMAANSNVEVSKIDILSKAEKSIILESINNTSSQYPRNLTLSQLFEQQVEKTPENIALSFEGKEITYRELNERANRFARFLRKKGVEAETIVGLLLDRSIDMMVGIMGILKAGGAYLPIDPDYPKERIASILSDSGTCFLVTSMELNKKLQNEKILEGSPLEVLIIDGPDRDFENEDGGNIKCVNNSSSPAYIMYTSGSTGMPKGTVTTHYNISRVVRNTNYIEITHEDTMLQLSNYAFDGSTFDIFGSLLNGAKLVLVSKQTVLDIVRLSEIIRDENISVFFVTTALFNTLADLNVECFKNVRKVLFGGERVSVPHVRKALEFVGPGRLIHVYGPTESTVFATYHFVDKIDRDIGTIPIGKPISNTKVYIVDKNNNLQPFGAPGELCISGDGLAKGYLHRDELTKEKFVKIPLFGEEDNLSAGFDKNDSEIMYRTGDLAKWLSDGSIEFLDRIDTQVKLRGFRIELGEIESRLLEYEGIKEAVVLAREDKKGNKYLCAYFTAQKDIDLSSLREYLLEKLPVYMVPSDFMRLEVMPLNSNGKIEKKALPEPQTHEGAIDYVAPESETEKKLALLWQEVLGVERVGTKDNFFELGGHSLKATVLAARIHKEFNKSVPLGRILNTKNLGELAQLLDGAEKNIYSQIKPVVNDENYLKLNYPKGVYPASSSQKRMFVQQQFEGIGTSYNIPLALTVEGGIDPEKVGRTFEALIKRHEPLRTSFEIYNGEIVQRVHEEVDIKLSLMDTPKESIDSVLKKLILPFDLSKAPLLRAALVKINDNRHVLLLDMHHIVSDGISATVLMREFGELYNDNSLPELKIQYKDFSYWHNNFLKSAEINKQQEYWRDNLSCEIPVLNMPCDFNRSDSRTFEGDIVEFKLDSKVSLSLSSMAKEYGVTLNTLLISAYTALLYRYTGQEDIIIGSLVAGRRHPDVENMIGMFNNFIPVRNKFKPDNTFKELVNIVNGSLSGAYENQDYPYDMMVEKFASGTERSRNPIFDTMLIFHNELERDIRLGIEGLDFKLHKTVSNTSKLDFKLDVYTGKSGELECIIEYNTGLFKKETMERLSKHFSNIVAEIIEKPDKKVSAIEMMTANEQNRILLDFNDTKCEYPREKTLSRVFEEQVEKTPDNVAVIFENEKLTYSELNKRANSLARVLREYGIKGDSIVAIMLERSIEMMVGILAVLKAGGAYLPISPDYPDERVRFMLEDSGANILLTKSNVDLTKSSVPLTKDNVVLAKDNEILARGNTNDIGLEDGENDPSGLTVLDLDDEVLYTGESSNLDEIITSKNLAYVIYTSGSTGKPKGAMIEHYSVINRINWMHKKYPIGEQDVILQKTPYTFDVSVWELFWWFFAGAKVCFLIPGGEKDPGAITEGIEKNKVTTMHFVPSMLNMFLEYMEDEKNLNSISSLRQVFASGEALGTKQVQRFNNQAGQKFGTKLINLYGPTEATVDVSYYDCPSTGEIELVPIGKPIDNIKLYIVDKNNNLQLVGIPGELCIAGDGLARGYLNRPELTKEKFVPNPFDDEDNLTHLNRMYRTGDLARWLPDGNIEYLGRLDHQVKIRGFRIELGEIEEELLKHESIKEVVVTARKDKEGSSYLCAYLVSDRELTPAELREHLTKNLPEYMVPSYFVRLDKMPLSPNGKADRKALPEPMGNVNTGVEYVEPVEEDEKKLAQILQDVLQCDRVGLNDNFFELGGHSLKAAALVSKIHKEFNVYISLGEIFKAPTVKGIIENIRKAERDIYSSIVPLEEKDYMDLSGEFCVYPVSSAQKRIFILERMGSLGTAYNLPGIMTVEGRIDKAAFENAFVQLVKRHETLRTSFDFINGEPVQKVYRNVDFRMSYDEAPEECAEEIIKEFIKEFDLKAAPLFRAKLVKISEEKHLLMFDMHHIISDGVSTVILVKEFIELYRGDDLPELKVQYRDYAAWQNKLFESDLIKKQQQYWKEVFSGEIPVLNMPQDYPRPATQSYKGDKITFSISGELAENLRNVAANTGTTMYMVLLAAYNILLHRYTGQEDIIVGSPTAGRPHADLENLAGMFVNTLALRNYISGHKNFRCFLDEVKNNVLKALENQDYQFEKLIDDLELKRDLSRNPLFDTLFVLQNMGIPETDVNGLKFIPFEFKNGVSKFDITLEAVEMSESIRFNLEYCTELFKRETMERLAKHFEKILEHIVKNLDIEISRIEMMTEDEQNRILLDFNDTKCKYPREKTLSRVFEEQVERTPDNVAVIFENEKLTYSELNRRANSLARVLREHGVKGDSIVAIMLERSIEMMVGILAVLKAGGAYLPISPDYPDERVRFMLEDSGANILLTKSNVDLTKSSVPLTKDNVVLAKDNEILARGNTNDIGLEDGENDPSGLTVLDLDDEVLYTGESSNLDEIITSKNLAYVIYTSGSTGKPKGAMIEHYSVINRINWMHKKYPIGEQDVILQKTPYTFDVSVWELFWWFFAGAKVCFLIPGGEKDPGAITEGIEKNKVTTMHFVPSMLNMFLEYMEDEKNLNSISSLRQVFASGEALGTKQVQRFNNQAGQKFGTKLINLYGPTEATVDVSYYDCPSTGEIELVPIGKPIDNIKLYIVDKNNNLQLVGIPGELCIAGDGLARGYLNRPELTKEKFVPNPFDDEDNLTHLNRMYRTGDLARWLPDGNIEYLGRLDHQVKIRGFRIELGEIEEELLKHESIKEVVVTARKDKEGSSYLCAYLVSDRELTPAELREHLTKNLPEYMVPSYFVRLDKMPLSPNGKADRKALPEPMGNVNTGVEYIEPAGVIEKKLAQIWREVLGVQNIGIKDNFFDLGGNSLLLIRMHSKIETEYPGRLRVTDIFSNPTILKLAQFIEKGGEEKKFVNLKCVEIPEPYFSRNGMGTKGSVFRFSLADEVLKSLNEMATREKIEISDILLSAYIYLFAQISKKHEVTVQVLLDDGAVLPLDMDLSNVDSLAELRRQINKSSTESSGDSYNLNDVKEERLAFKGENEILPLFYSKKDSKGMGDLTGIFDLVLEASNENGGLSLTCEYNGARLKSERVKEMLNQYMKVLQFMWSSSL